MPRLVKQQFPNWDPFRDARLLSIPSSIFKSRKYTSAATCSTRDIAPHSTYHPHIPSPPNPPQNPDKSPITIRNPHHLVKAMARGGRGGGGGGGGGKSSQSGSVPSRDKSTQSGERPPRGGGGRAPDRETLISKKLSWLLRHGAEKEGLVLGRGGYVGLGDVVSHLRNFPPV